MVTLRRRGWRVGTWQQVAWHAGWLLTAIGLLSPIDGLGEANAGFAKQIEQIDGRAAATRDRLVARFSAMESALSVAKTMLDQIRAQIDAFNGQN